MIALAEIRTARGIRINELAHRAGITTAFAQRLEIGVAPSTWRALARIADALNCSTDQILGRAVATSAPIDIRSSDAIALDREDRELLDAMKRYALDLLGPQIIGKNGGGWRAIARAAWLGDLTRIRDYTLERPALPPGEMPKPPAGWRSGWESKRQRQLVRGTP